MIIRLLWLTLMLSTTIPATAATPAGWAPLMDARSLAELLDTGTPIRLLRVSGDHATGHIPGSVPAVYGDFRGPADNPGQLPALDSLTATVRSLGLTPDLPVVLVHQGASPSDMGTATRIYWTLKSLGLQDLAILNGGFAAWQQAGLPVSTGSESVTASDWSPRWHDDWRITTAEIESRLDDTDTGLIDARPSGFFEGSRSSVARPGTIRGATSLSFERWFDGNRMKPVVEIRQTLASSPLPETAQAVSFCNTGHWASINWFVLSELAGVPDTRLYAESMAEWSRSDRPMDNQPSRIAHYWNMTAEWFAGLWER